MVHPLFYLPLAVITWLSARWLVDLRQAGRLLVYGLLGATLATVQDRLVVFHRLWEYRDIGPVGGHAETALLISLSAAPLFAMRFAQGLIPGAPLPWKRMMRYTAIAMLPEVAGAAAGHIVYHNGWNLGWSVAAYVPIWSAIWALHRWLSQPASVRQPDFRRTTAPGT